MKWKVIYWLLVVVAVFGVVADPATHLPTSENITSSVVRRVAWAIGCLLVGMLLEMVAEASTQAKKRVMGTGYDGPAIESLIRAALVYAFTGGYFFLCALDFVWLRGMLPITRESSTKWFLIGLVVGGVVVFAMLRSLMFGPRVKREPR